MMITIIVIIMIIVMMMIIIIIIIIMICKRVGFVTQRHNELRDLEAELLNMVCTDVEIEPVLQAISGEQL